MVKKRFTMKEKINKIESIEKIRKFQASFFYAENKLKKSFQHEKYSQTRGIIRIQMFTINQKNLKIVD